MLSNLKKHFRIWLGFPYFFFFKLSKTSAILFLVSARKALLEPFNCIQIRALLGGMEPLTSMTVDVFVEVE